MNIQNDFINAKGFIVGSKLFAFPKGQIISSVSGYTAKSIILDCADAHGTASYLGIRSVDFYKNSSLLPLTISDITCYSTTEFSASYSPDKTFITSLSKIGEFISTQWLTSSGVFINQRIICVFNTVIDFDSIVINNGHSTGAVTNTGVQNVKIHVSSDIITSTAYNEAIANSTKIFDGVFSIHVSSNVQDDQTLTLI